jgi:hypothetical protein
MSDIVQKRWGFCHTLRHDSRSLRHASARQRQNGGVNGRDGWSSSTFGHREARDAR